MPKKTKVKVKQPKKPTKKASNKNKNKNIQSVKVNVSSSGGLGGSGGTTIPQPRYTQQPIIQPQPIIQQQPYFIPQYIRNERLIPQKEQNVFNNIIKKSIESQTEPTEPTEPIFYEENNEEPESESEFFGKLFFDNPLLRRNENKNNNSLLQNLEEENKPSPSPSPTPSPTLTPSLESESQEIGVGGGGGGSGPVSYINAEIDPLKERTYIKKVGRKYEFKFRQADGVKYDTLAEAQIARDKFIKDNNIKFKEKKNK